MIHTSGGQFSSPRIFEFSIDEVVAARSDPLHVLGRNRDFPIRIDDTFDRIYSYLPRKFPEEAGVEPIRGEEKTVALRVVGIHAYQRSLAELGQGMTGALWLEGEGTELILPDWNLGTIIKVTS